MSNTLKRGHVPTGIILALACVGQFMVVLDISIVNVALPNIGHSLGYSRSGLQWVVNAYTLTFAGFLLLGGRAADLLGRRRVFIWGLGLFSAASLAGGLAQSGAMLTIARAAQGLGGAVLAPATLTILITTYGAGKERARALGIWSAVAGAGGAVGALFGGILTQYLSWRWILFINVPIGLAAIAVAMRFLTESRREGPVSRRMLDLPGAITGTAGLALLIYGIVNTTTNSWTSAQTLGTLAAAVVLLALFILIEAKLSSHPLMPLRLFRSRSVSGANLSMFLVGGGFFAMFYFLTLYLQDVLGYDPIKAGLAFLPSSAAIIVGTQISARLVSKLGPRPLLVIGLTISGVGLLLLGHVGATSSFATAVLVPSMLATFGVGMGFTPLAIAGTAGVAYDESGLASGILNTSRQVGGSIGLAALATLALDQTNSRLHQAGATHSGALSALTSGYTHAFTVAALLSFAAAVAALIIPTIKAAGAMTRTGPPPAVTHPDPAQSGQTALEPAVQGAPAG